MAVVECACVRAVAELCLLVASGSAVLGVRGLTA